MKGILIDNGKLMVTGGELAIGECSADLAERIMIAWTGEYKEAPLLGGNAKKLIAGTPDPFWKGNVKAQLMGEGIEVSELTVTNEGIELRIKN